MEKLDLHGKTGFIIGGTRGIGNAIAMRMAGLGMNLTVIARKEDELAAMKAQVESLGVRFLGIQASNTDFDAIAAAFETSWQTYGRLDLLVNAAGTGVMTPFEELTKSDVDTTIDVNLKGTFNCCKAAAQRMMKQRYGRIVNLSSVVGVAGNAGQANYAASKAGVIGLTKSIARELAARNVTANAVAPGFIATDMTDALSEKQREAILGRIASKRLGEPEDVAKLVRFLASEEAGYITGQVICIDGGMSL